MSSGPDYLQELKRILQEKNQLPVLEADSYLTTPEKPPKRSLGMKVVRRLIRYFRRIGTLARGRFTRSYWLPSRDIPILPLNRNAPPIYKSLNVAVHLHVYFMDLLPELLENLERIPCKVSVYATTNTQVKAKAVATLLSRHPSVDGFETIVTPNRGRDIGPWLVEMAQFNDCHDLWCHLHTKKSLHAPEVGQSWRTFLLNQLVGSENTVRLILSAFQDDPKLGLVFPPFHTPAVKEEFLGWDDPARTEEVFRMLKINTPIPKHPFFPAGTMCWYRGQALATLFRAGLAYEDFEPELGQIGFTLMHIIERAIPYVAHMNGFGYRVTMPVTR